MFKFFAAVGQAIWNTIQAIGYGTFKLTWSQALSLATLAVGVKGYMQARQMMAKGQDILANKTAAGGKIPIIYGTRRVGAQVVYMDVSNNDSRHVFLVYALSVGECEEVLGKTIQLDGNPLTDSARFKYGCYVGSDKISSGSGSLNTVSQVGSTISAGAGQFGTSPTSRYRITFNIHHGAASQTADPMLVASMPNWTSAHRLDGICYIAAHYKFDKEGMFSGIPQMTVQVRGKKVYDPRDSGQTFGTPSTYEFSSNPALCFLDYITNNEYGKGLTSSQINMSTFSSAANVCDTQVDQPYFNGTAQSLTWSGTSGDNFITIEGTTPNDDWWQNKIGELITLYDSNGDGVLTGREIADVQRDEFFDQNPLYRVYFNTTLSSNYSSQTGSSLLKVKRFTTNGYLDTNKNVMENAKELLANMRGIFLYINGQYELQIEDTGSSSFSINDNHIIADAGISVDYGNKDKKANKVIVEFFNANKRYELDTATVLHDATPEYYSDDNDEILEIKAEFPYITDPYIAYNMGKAILTRSRNQITMQFLGTPEMYKLNVGDIVDLTYAGLGFSGKVCRVEALELQPNGLVAVSLIEYFDVYTWEVPPQEPVEELANTPSAYAVKAPTGLTFTDTDSSSTGRPFLSWNEPTDFPDYQYRVNVVDSSSNQVLNRIVDVENCDLNFLPVNANYVASVTSLNTLGSESSAATLTFTIGDAPTATADIKNDAITTPKILDNAVTDAKINSLSANKITAGTIDASQITVTNLDADNITSGTLDADTVTVSGGDVTINSSGITINGSSSSINLGSGAFTVSSAGVMTATGATISGALTATSLNVTGATVTGTLDASTILLDGDPLDDLFGVAGSGSAKTLSIGADVKNQLKVDGTQMIYTAYDSLQSDGDDALIMNHGSATFYSGSQSTGWQTTTIYAGDESTAGGILTDRITIDATATGLNSSYRFYVNGEAFFDDPITLDTVSAPATTTNKLYNVGGSLYWNGSAVNTGAGDITGVTITTTGGSLTGGAAYTSGDAIFTLDIGSTITGAKTFDNNVVIQGDLDVQGTTTTIDTTNLDVKDKNITLNYGTGDTSANANGAGITIQDAVSAGNDATLTWNTSDDTFNFSHPLVTSKSLILNASGTSSTFIEVGASTSSNHYSYIDLIGDATYTDYGLRIIRNNSGANTTSGIYHRGTGDLILETIDSAAIKIRTSATDALTISSSGDVTIGGTDAGNKTLTISGGATGNAEGGEIRLATAADYDTTYDFYRIDVNQDSFRIGRAGTTDLTINSSGNATFAGNVTATAFYGDGSNLTNITTTTINNNADNRIITGSGTANTLNAESTLTYDGTTLKNDRANGSGSIVGIQLTAGSSINDNISLDFGSTTANAFSLQYDHYQDRLNLLDAGSNVFYVSGGVVSFTTAPTFGGGLTVPSLTVTGNGTIQTGAAGLIKGGYYQVGSTTVIDTSRNLTNIGTISSGAITAPSINNTATVTVNNSGAGATLTVNRVSGNPNIKAGTDDSGYLIMDSSGGNAALNWYSSDRVVLAQGGGNVSIGINSGTDKLNVAGSIGIGGTTVIDSSRNLTNIGTISSGAITCGAIDATISGEEVIRVNTTGNTAAIHWRDSDVIRGLMGFSNGNSIYSGADDHDMVIRSESKLHLVSNVSNLGITLNGGNATFGGTISSGAITSSSYGVFGNVSIDPDSFSSYAGGFGNIADTGWGARGLFVHGGGTGDGAAIGHNGGNLYFGIQNGSSANSMSTYMVVTPAKAISMTDAASVALPNTTAGTISSGAITASGDITANSGFVKIAASSTSEGGELTLLRPTSGTTDINIDNYQNYLRVHASGSVWATVDSGGISSNSFQIGGTTVIDSSRNLTNIGTISSSNLTVQPAIGAGDALVTVAQTNVNAYVHAGIKINAGNTNPFYIYQSGSSNTLRFNYNSLSDAGGQMVLTDAGNLSVSGNVTVGSGILTVQATGYGGGQIGLGDWANSNPIGISEGLWDTVTTDNDFITIYSRNSFNIRGYAGGSTTAHWLSLTSSALNLVQSQSLQMGGTTVIDSARAFSNVASLTIDSTTNSASLNYGSGGSRTFTKNDAGASASQSGFFETASPSNYYSGASSWQHLMEARHSNNSNNYAMQIAGSFFDQSFYGRKTNNSASTSWTQFAMHNTTVTFSEVRSTGNVTAYYSDERLKDFTGKIDNAIDKVKQLNGYYFKENKKAKELGYDNDKQQVGVNAQEVQKVLPEVIDIAPISHTEGVDEEYLTVHYEKLVPLLIEAIKDQQQQIDELKAKIENGSS